MKKQSFSFGLILIGTIVISACQVTLPRQLPPEEMIRHEDTPFVAAIPGLNLAAIADQRIYFGDMNRMLDQEGIPNVVVLYDTRNDPVTSASDLHSDTHSVTVLRVLPRLVTAISRENQIRAQQGLPPVKDLVLATYSQGGVVAWDISRRIIRFRKELADFKKAVGKEWEQLQKDPKFEALNDAIMNFFLIYNVRYQEEKVFKHYVDLQNVYYRGERNMDKAIERMQAYMRPEKGKPPYPKINKWIDKTYGGPAKHDIEKEDFKEAFSKNFFLRYAAFRYLLDLEDVRIFSITSSFYGSTEAFKGYFYAKYFPWLSQPIIQGRDEQLGDTRLGSQHHLDWTKKLIRNHEKQDAYIGDIHFIVGVGGIFGNKGDGLVGQPAAHVSDHDLAEVPLSQVLESLEGDKSLSLEWHSLPDYPVTGLRVHHLPRKFLFYRSQGAAQMDEESKVFPFFLAFINEDHEEINALHERNQRPMKQFMICVYLADTEELNRKNFKLKPISKGIKMTGRYDNPAANSMNWTGYFKSDKQKEGEVLLTVSKDGKKTEVKFPIYPGHINFIDIMKDEVAREEAAA